MEQAVLKRFDRACHSHNHEIVAGLVKDDLEIGWTSCLADVKRRARDGGGA